MAEPLSHLPGKVGEQLGNVFRPFAEWRDVEPHHVEAVIQVRAELTALHSLLDGTAGGCKHPDVDPPRVPPAETANLALFQHSQDLGLEPR
jgi:hypothetical protein